MKTKIIFGLFFFSIGCLADNVLFLGNSLSVLPGADHFGGHVYRDLENSQQIEGHESYSRSGWNTANFLEGSSRTTRRRKLQLRAGTLPPLEQLIELNRSDVVISQLGTNMFYYLVYFGEQKIHQMLSDYLSVLPEEAKCVWILPPHIGHGHLKTLSLRDGSSLSVSYNAYQYYMEKVMAEYLSGRCYLFDSLDLEVMLNGDSLNDYIHYHNESPPPGVERMEEFWARQFMNEYEVIETWALTPEEYNQSVLRRMRARFSLKKNLRPYFQHRGISYSYEKLIPLKEL